MGHNIINLAKISNLSYFSCGFYTPPSPDYIPGPAAPPSPDYIPRPEAPPSPNYIPKPEYPEYIPPADDVLPAEEQPLPAAVSPTAESPGHIKDSEPEMEPEEEDGDDEKSEEDSINYLASRGDDDADDDGDDLSKDDADEEESSDRVERLLAIPTPPLSPVSPTSYLLPPFLMPLPIFTPLPPPPPIILPRTRDESIPEVDIPLRKRARFTTHTGGYEVCESSITAAARQIRPTLTIADSRRAEDRLIGRLRKERRYFRTLSTTYTKEIDDGDRLTRHIQYEHAQRDDAPEDGDSCS
nr:hypothetical protein [Tanacetum cinerariifolium]